MIQHIPETVIFKRSDIFLSANFVGVHPEGIVIFQRNNTINAQHDNGLQHFLENIFHFLKGGLEKVGLK